MRYRRASARRGLHGPEVPQRPPATSITGRANYARAGRLIGEPDLLVSQPERLLEPDIAMRVLVAQLEDAVKNTPGGDASRDFTALSRALGERPSQSQLLAREFEAAYPLAQALRAEGGQRKSAK